MSVVDRSQALLDSLENDINLHAHQLRADFLAQADEPSPGPEQTENLTRLTVGSDNIIIDPNSARPARSELTFGQMFASSRAIWTTIDNMRVRASSAGRRATSSDAM